MHAFASLACEMSYVDDFLPGVIQSGKYTYEKLSLWKLLFPRTTIACYKRWKNKISINSYSHVYIMYVCQCEFNFKHPIVFFETFSIPTIANKFLEKKKNLVFVDAFL